jgi:hypothetical protein
VAPTPRVVRVDSARRVHPRSGRRSVGGDGRASVPESARRIGIVRSVRDGRGLFPDREAIPAVGIAVAAAAVTLP